MMVWSGLPPVWGRAGHWLWLQGAACWWCCLAGAVRRALVGRLLVVGLAGGAGPVGAHRPRTIWAAGAASDVGYLVDPVAVGCHAGVFLRLLVGVAGGADADLRAVGDLRAAGVAVVGVAGDARAADRRCADAVDAVRCR